MPPKKMTDEETAYAAVVMPKGKEKDKADTGTPKDKAESKRDRESPFKSPAAKKKIALDDDMVADNEV